LEAKAMSDWISAIILGVVEGLTEFIPVSSTGHLLLTKMLLGLPNGFWDTFSVLIQLGAILAMVALDFSRLWAVLLGLPSQPQARRFAASVLIAFLPGAVAGMVLHDLIKDVLFESPRLICWSLLIGGFVLLAVDRWAPPARETDAMALPWMTAFLVGAAQTLALIPGVSRSGGTIVASMLLRVEKRAAAEFSFFLAIPTMAGAFALDLWKNRHALNTDQAGLIALGFAVSFVVGYVVVKKTLDFVSARGFAPFAWWRILVGAGGLVWLTTHASRARSGPLGGQAFRLVGVLTALAETVEIGGQDRFHRGRRKAKVRKPRIGPAGHIVGLEQFHLVAGQRRGQGDQAGQLSDLADQIGDGKGQGNQKPVALGLGVDELQDFLEAEDAWAAEFIGLARSFGVGNHLGDGLGDIPHKHRLELRVAAADQRQDGAEHRHLGEEIEEAVPLTKDDRRPDDDGVREFFAHGGLAHGLGPGVLCFRGFVCADGRHLHQGCDAHFPGGLGDIARAHGVDALELLAAAFIKQANQVHGSARPFEGALHRGRIADIGLDHLDLAHIAQKSHGVRQMRLADGDPYAGALTGQGAHHLAADKPRTAEDGDQILHGCDPKGAKTGPAIDDAALRRNQSDVRYRRLRR